ncbi:uncharacterized protein EDB93DRAFT_1066208, partial [Suillus bovinus]|uniref:uncharacterized protein n=1 Tax=Suillus bovinus TaxID=48563 RepID=UPI001B8818D8
IGYFFTTTTFFLPLLKTISLSKSTRIGPQHYLVSTSITHITQHHYKHSVSKAVAVHFTCVRIQEKGVHVRVNMIVPDIFPPEI